MYITGKSRFNTRFLFSDLFSNDVFATKDRDANIEVGKQTTRETTVVNDALQVADDLTETNDGNRNQRSEMFVDNSTISSIDDVINQLKTINS